MVTYGQRQQGRYPATPNWFSPDTEASRATSLFFAIIALSSGHFPEQVDMLTNMLVSIFDGVECDKDGNRHLDQLTYHKAGIISNKDGKMVIAPPVTFENRKDEKDDTADRMKAINGILKYTRHMTRIPEGQLRYAITERKPVIKNGAVGRSLEKISRITCSIEAAGEAVTSTDAFSGLVRKILDETEGTINPKLHHKTYILCRRMCDNDTYKDCVSAYGIEYMPGGVLEEIAAQLSSGPIDHYRVTGIIDTAYRKKPFPKTWFVSMGTALGTMNVEGYAMTSAYENEVRQYLSAAGLEIGTDVMWDYESHGKTYTQRVDTYSMAAHYAAAMLSARVHAAEAVYDAIQAYAMYDAIGDEKVRDFLVKAGYLIKDWKPDPDLWLRAARTVPACFGRNGANPFGYADGLRLTPEIHDGAAKIAEKYADEVLERLSDSINAGTVQTKIRKILGNQGENQD